MARQIAPVRERVHLPQLNTTVGSLTFETVTMRCGHDEHVMYRLGQTNIIRQLESWHATARVNVCKKCKVEGKK